MSLAVSNSQETLGQKIGHFGRDLSEDVKRGYQETRKAGQEVLHESKKVGKQASQEVKDGSISFWGRTKQRVKKFWHDVKEGFADND